MNQWHPTTTTVRRDVRRYLTQYPPPVLKSQPPLSPPSSFLGLLIPKIRKLCASQSSSLISGLLWVWGISTKTYSQGNTTDDSYNKYFWSTYCSRRTLANKTDKVPTPKELIFSLERQYPQPSAPRLPIDKFLVNTSQTNKTWEKQGTVREYWQTQWSAKLDTSRVLIRIIRHSTKLCSVFCVCVGT